MVKVFLNLTVNEMYQPMQNFRMKEGLKMQIKYIEEYIMSVEVR
jgi:hypothetical protein